MTQVHTVATKMAKVGRRLDRLRKGRWFPSPKELSMLRDLSHQEWCEWHHLYSASSWEGRADSFVVHMRRKYNIQPRASRERVGSIRTAIARFD